MGLKRIMLWQLNITKNVYKYIQGIIRASIMLLIGHKCLEIRSKQSNGTIELLK